MLSSYRQQRMRSHPLPFPCGSYTVTYQVTQCGFHWNWFSPKPVPFYHDKFLPQPNDLIRLDILYCSEERSTLSVALTDEQRDFFQVQGSVPHVSLTRGPATSGRIWGHLLKCVKRLLTGSIILVNVKTSAEPELPELTLVG